MFKKIFIPYDLSKPGENGLRWALYLAQHFGAAAEVFHVLPQEKHLEEKYEEVQSQMEQDIQTSIKAYSDPKIGPGLKSCDTRFAVGSASQLILEEIEEKKPDLVVVSTHGWTGLKHFFLGSKAEQIVRHSLSPVLLVRKTPHWPFKRILIPVDFSEYTESALLMAAHFENFKGTQFEILHVLSMPDLMHYAPDYGVQLPPDLMGTLQVSAKEELENLKQKHASLKAEITLKTGSVADEICEHAKETQADLIIMPTHGHTGLTHLLMGSVAEQVLRYAPCSVLSFRPS